MILGAVCTRACTFCNVATGRPDLLDPHEPERVGGGGRQARPQPHRRDLGRPRRPRRRRRRPFRAHDRRDPRRRAGDDDRGAGARFPAQGRRDRDRRRGQARRPQPQSRNRAAALCRGAARRALFPSLRLLDQAKRLDPAVFTKSGIMVGLGEDARRGIAGDGRSARGRGRFPDDRAISAADAEAPPGRPLRHPGRVRELSPAWRSARAF